MKHLLLMRHAKSSWDDPSQTDHERPLNPRGRRAAPLMGRLLQDERLIPDAIFCSSAMRARQTAEQIGQACEYAGDVNVVPELYMADISTWTAVVQKIPDQHDRVLLVGHNSGIEQFVSLLAGSSRRMPTAAIAAFEIAVASWTEFTPGRSDAALAGYWRPNELG